MDAGGPARRGGPRGARSPARPPGEAGAGAGGPAGGDYPGHEHDPGDDDVRLRVPATLDEDDLLDEEEGEPERLPGGRRRQQQQKQQKQKQQKQQQHEDDDDEELVHSPFSHGNRRGSFTGILQKAPKAGAANNARGKPRSSSRGGPPASPAGFGAAGGPNIVQPGYGASAVAGPGTGAGTSFGQGAAPGQVYGASHRRRDSSDTCSTCGDHRRGALHRAHRPRRGDAAKAPQRSLFGIFRRSGANSVTVPDVENQLPRPPPPPPPPLQQPGSPNVIALRRGRLGSSATLSSQSSFSSILSSNLKRVRSISNLLTANQHHHHHHNHHHHHHRGGQNFGHASMGSSEYTMSDVSEDPDASWSRRILSRDHWYHQSTGELYIDQVGSQPVQREIFSLYRDDWFHVALTQRTCVLFLSLIIIYTAYLLVFAGLYALFKDPTDVNCALDVMDPSETDDHPFLISFAFALETAATSGFGLPDNQQGAFWRNCFQLPTVIWWQSFFGVLLNALCISLVVMRVGRADLRSHQVVFSNKACVVHRDGKFYFSFQCYDLDMNAPIVEAHVRCYVVLNESDGNTTANFQTRHMRLINPDDDLGANLFLSVPCTVVHEIDQWSPLLPPTMRREHWQTHDDGFVHNQANRYRYPNLCLREADAASGGRDGAQCPVCGYTLFTDEHLLRHIRYQQYLEGIYFGDEDDDEEDEDDEEEEHDGETGSAAIRRASADGADPLDAAIPRLGIRIRDESPSPDDRDARDARESTSKSRSSSRDRHTDSETSHEPDDSIEQPEAQSDVKDPSAPPAMLSPLLSAFMPPDETDPGPGPHHDHHGVIFAPADTDQIEQTKSMPARPQDMDGNGLLYGAGDRLAAHSFHSTDSAGRGAGLNSDRAREDSRHSSHSQRRRSHSHHYSSARANSIHQRLEKAYQDQVRRGTSRRIHHHKTVKLGRIRGTIDERLKELSDINKPSGHFGLEVEALISRDRVVLESEERARREAEEHQCREAAEAGLRESSASASRVRQGSSLHPMSKYAKDVKYSIQHFIEASELEIIVIVEGIEAQSSATFQARHSYTMDDIMYDHWFRECFGPDEKKTSKIVVNLNHFHDTVPLSESTPIPVQSVL